MKYISSYVFRAVCAIVIGVLLVKSPDNTLIGLTLITGFLFLVSGIISCSTYFGMIRHGGEVTLSGVKRKPVFPIVGIGCFLFGALMVFDPDFFVRFLMYIFGGVLVLGAFNEFLMLGRVLKMAKVALYFWIMPTVILICGLIILFKPMESAELPFIISGWCLLLYGLNEIISAMKLYKVGKQIRDIKKNMTVNQEFSDVENFEKKKD